MMELKIKALDPRIGREIPFFHDTAPAEIYTLSLHGAVPI